MEQETLEKIIGGLIGASTVTFMISVLLLNWVTRLAGRVAALQCRCEQMQHCLTDLEFERLKSKPGVSFESLDDEDRLNLGPL